MGETCPIIDDYEIEAANKPVRLADVLQMPQTEPVKQTDPDESDSAALPPTTLELQKVFEIFHSEDMKPDERVQRQLTLALMAAPVVERAVPSGLLPFITDSPADWYEANKTMVGNIIGEPAAVQALYERTELYAACPFLRNAADINDAAWSIGKGHEGRIIELSARMIVLEAMTASNQ